MLFIFFACHIDTEFFNVWDRGEKEKERMPVSFWWKKGKTKERKKKQKIYYDTDEFLGQVVEKKLKSDGGILMDGEYIVGVLPLPSVDKEGFLGKLRGLETPLLETGEVSHTCLRPLLSHLSSLDNRENLEKVDKAFFKVKEKGYAIPKPFREYVTLSFFFSFFSFFLEFFILD